MYNKKIIIIAGHYGCGKTNIAVNLAAELAKEGQAVSIVDLDIVNPYFRTADNNKMLTSFGVDTILPEFANTNVDIPSLPVRFKSIFVSDRTAIIDVGGDDDGAVVLGGYAKDIINTGYEMYFVYNKYRPSIADVNNAYYMMLAIEHSSKLKFDGIINNSNLGEETTTDDILSALPDAKKLAEISGKPLFTTTALKRLKQELITTAPDENFIFIDDITKKIF
ncbi:MAG: hypothetical protein A2Y17_09480 [Clostridiales bacterium GWF2_38_85]|nr:MAG: hypothetical protein A2Y17_09480 [Clostridiales bacterium GWF2_38_85]HBL83571.1 hypothetical protein [Clostridiales bacterium]